MATNDTTSTPADDATASGLTTDPAASTAAPRRRGGRALAITGIAVGSALTLGLTFAGGVALGQVLPGGPGDRGPVSGEAGSATDGQRGDRGDQMAERIGERIEQRMDARMEQRQEQRDELRAQFEQWLQEQGIDPSAPTEPTE